MRITSLIIILAFLFSFGCASAPVLKGKPIDAAARAELVKGKTTQAQVTKLLGQPSYAEPLGVDREKLVYEYYKEIYTTWYKPNYHDKQTLNVYMQKGIVEKYDFSQEIVGEIEKGEK